MWFINAFISIIVFVSSSNTAFTHPFGITLSVVMMAGLLLMALNADNAADRDDLVSLLTLSSADKSTVDLYRSTSC